jgi:hypothetical protein
MDTDWTARPLSRRATEYLARLERVRVPPEREVRDFLSKRMSDVPQPWLLFHQTYGGIVEYLGSDKVVLGLMHYDSQWLDPLSCQLLDDPGESDTYVTCADAHPSYSFMLSRVGEFLGGPAESFEVQLERWALEIEFKAQSPGGFDIVYSLKDVPTTLVPLVEDVLSRGEVTEASDKFKRMYQGNGVLLTHSEGHTSYWLRRA